MVVVKVGIYEQVGIFLFLEQVDIFGAILF